MPPAKAVLLALTYRQVAHVGRSRLPGIYVKWLNRWQYGPGAFKVDWALNGVIPWEAKDVGRAATVHVGGSLEEIAEAERAPSEGRVADRPFVLLCQPTLADNSRAKGKHIAWGYCHVPNGWEGDATEAIENQVERFAPGFKKIIAGRATHGPRDLEAWNANLVGGDVNGGAITLKQMFGPGRWSINPWGTPVKDLYICSASTPPGAR